MRCAGPTGYGWLARQLLPLAAPDTPMRSLTPFYRFAMLPTFHIRASSPADLFGQFQRDTVEPLRRWFHLPLAAVSLETPLDGHPLGPALPVSDYERSHASPAQRIAARHGREVRECIVEDLMKPGETSSTSANTPGIEPFDSFLDRRLQVLITRDESRTFWIILHVEHVTTTQLVDVIDGITAALDGLPKLPHLHVVGTMLLRGRYPKCPLYPSNPL